MPESQEIPDTRNGHAECEDLEHIDLRPITLDDIAVAPGHNQQDDSAIIDWKKRDHFVSSFTGKRKRVTKLRSESNLWNRALSKVNSMTDCWDNFDVKGLSTERATRYRYKALTGHWVTDQVTVKMEPEAFNSGAMRRCFRAKKLSNFTHGESWHRQCNNYVAKEYMTSVERQTYFDDVKLQMEAKLWSEEYNRHNPPKKVDIMQMCVVEMTDRPDRPLFHFEHFIEGHYVKYNSNSGFVRDENLRLTPQAFSHFTFERSGHELMVVDVQGVGDLYTDPQIHTAEGDCYGDGNLGTRGMALFFHSHVCNTICRGLSLTEFDLASSEDRELSVQKEEQRLCKTVSRGLEEVCASPREHAFNLHEFMRRRSSSSGCWSDAGDTAHSPGVEPASPLYNDSSDSIRNSLFAKRTRFVSESSTGSNDASEAARFQTSIETSPIGRSPRDCEMASALSCDVTHGGDVTGCASMRRTRTEPCLTCSEPSLSPRSQGSAVVPKLDLQDVISKKQRPSNIEAELDRMNNAPEVPSILGQIHFDLAKYHEVGRFLGADKAGEYDRVAGLFHLERAVDCGVLQAIVTAADIYLGRPHDLLSDIQKEDTPEHRREGLSLLERAAKAGNRAAMVDVAQSYELGTYLPQGEADRDWDTAVTWYLRAVETPTDESDKPAYSLLGRAAEMLKSGGPRLVPDFSRAAELFNAAAEEASAAMKGRVANKYFMEGEECWGMCEEEGEEATEG